MKSTFFMPHRPRSHALVLAIGMGAACGGAVAQPVPNPFLSAPVYGQTHFDPGQTDTFPYAVAKGTFRVDPTRALRLPAGPVNIQNLAAARPGFMWAISTDRVAYVDARDGRWKAVAEMALPGVERRSAADLDRLLGPRYKNREHAEQLVRQLLGKGSILINGLYTVADRDDVVYVNSGTQINAIGLKDAANPAAGLELKRTLDTTKVFKARSLPGSPPFVNLIGMSMTYDGQLVIGAMNGIAVIDRGFARPAVVHEIEEEQAISNSFSVDEKNGIYVASGSLRPRGDGILRRLQWTGSAISTAEADGAWASPYDGGDFPTSVKFGTGTGSTPTLMGFGPGDDKLVVLTDGSNRMKIVAFWREQIPPDFKQKPGTKSRRIADQMPITAGLPANTPWVQSEQSVVAHGRGAFVVNNIVPGGHPDKFVDALVNGPIDAPPHGMERVEWQPDQRAWRSVWTRGDVASTSMVPVASSASGIVFVNGYSKADGWEVTGMDWANGKTVHRTIMGRSNLGNGAYAILQFAENGDLLFNSVGGPLRVPLRAAR
jgi:hypothetical protein